MYFMNFSDNVKWSPKNMWKADGKANVKQQEIKDHLVVVSYKFLSEVLSKHKKIPCKKCVLSFKNLLSRQNLLSMAKMICWWPLMTPKMFFHLNIITLTKCITLKYFTKAIRNPVPYK